MLIATIRILTNPENRKELMQTLQSLSDPIKSETGCKSCRVYREVGNDEAVILIQEWESRDDWDGHIRSDDFAVMMGAMRLLQEPDTVEVQLLNPMEASDSMKALRARNFRELGEPYDFPQIYSTETGRDTQN